MAKELAVRPGGQIIKVKNPLNPDRIRTGAVLSWSFGRPKAIMDDNHETRYFPPDWVTVIQEAPIAEEAVCKCPAELCQCGHAPVEEVSDSDDDDDPDEDPEQESENADA
jgi:hypothetical protein